MLAYCSHNQSMCKVVPHMTTLAIQVQSILKSGTICLRARAFVRASKRAHTISHVPVPPLGLCLLLFSTKCYQLEINITNTFACNDTVSVLSVDLCRWDEDNISYVIRNQRFFRIDTHMSICACMVSHIYAPSRTHIHTHAHAHARTHPHTQAYTNWLQLGCGRRRWLDGAFISVTIIEPKQLRNWINLADWRINVSSSGLDI